MRRPPHDSNSPQTHLGFAFSPPSLLPPDRWRATAIGRAGLQNRRPQRSCTGRGRIRFLGSALRDCLIASVLLHCIDNTARLPLRQACVTRRRQERQNRLFCPVIIKKETYVHLAWIMSYILFLFTCLDMILLDSLVQVLLVGLSRSVSYAILFIIYYRIKSKLKVLIFPIAGASPSSRG